VTPLAEPYAGPGVYLHIPPLLEDEIDERTNQPFFLPAISALEDAFAQLVAQSE
jgi:hypothetical protein